MAVKRGWKRQHRASHFCWMAALAKAAAGPRDHGTRPPHALNLPLTRISNLPGLSPGSIRALVKRALPGWTPPQRPSFPPRSTVLSTSVEPDATGDSASSTYIRQFASTRHRSGRGTRRLVGRARSRQRGPSVVGRTSANELILVIVKSAAVRQLLRPPKAVPDEGRVLSALQADHARGCHPFRDAA